MKRDCGWSVHVRSDACQTRDMRMRRFLPICLCSNGAAAAMMMMTEGKNRFLPPIPQAKNLFGILRYARPSSLYAASHRLGFHRKINIKANAHFVRPLFPILPRRIDLISSIKKVPLPGGEN